MKPSRRIQKTICSTKVAPHWASQCKLSQGKDFASKLEPLEEKRLATIGTSNRHEQELDELEAYFGMVSGDSRAPGAAISFAVLSMGPSSVKRTAKFAMKLQRAAENRRAHNDVDTSHAESGDIGEVRASTTTTFDTVVQSPQLGKPTVTFIETSPLLSPSLSLGSIPSLSPSPSPGVRDPVTIQELHEATAPVRIRRQDLEPIVPRRAVYDGGAREDGSGSHYAYFQRHLPHESPRHRAAMHKRVAEERQMQPSLWIRGPHPRRVSP